MDFTLLRLLLAVSVACAHYGELTGVRPGWAQGLSATVAVQAFFVVSGWIVTASYESSTSAAAFFVRRLARLYPLYAAVVVAQALGAMALAAQPPDVAAELLHYLGANLVFANFLKPTLLGLLADAPVEAINPSLWTLKIEVLFYASVPLWAMLARRWGGWALLGVFSASTLYAYAAEPVSAELAKQLPGQLRFFVAGMMCRALLAGDHLPSPAHRRWLAGAGIAGLAWAQCFDRSQALAVLQPLAVAAFVVAAAALLPSMRRLPDISFGVYLMHAPLIQASREAGWLAPGAPGLLAILAATGLLSLAAFHLIEQPAIRAGRRLSDRLAVSRRTAPSARGATP
jgi:peptidoglycan/LPS O-acetylase OafA/YrhL